MKSSFYTPISLSFRFAMLSPSTAPSSAAHTGEWVDSNSNERPDASEKVNYTITVTNAGTVTLKNVEATSTSGDVVCPDDVAQPVAELRVGDSYVCTAAHSVRVLRLVRVLTRCGGQSRLPGSAADPVSWAVKMLHSSRTPKARKAATSRAFA